MDLGLWRGVRGYAHAFTCRVTVCTYSQIRYDLRSEIPGFQSSAFISGQLSPAWTLNIEVGQKGTTS